MILFFLGCSLIISSIIPSSNKSPEDNFIALAASNIFLGSRHKIVAHPSGDITEYIAFSNIITLLEEASAIAPPESIDHPWINKALERAQQKVEARNFDIRKTLIKFDNVLNDQRHVNLTQ